MLSGYLAVIFLVVMGILIVIQIVGRFIDLTFDATELSGFCLAAMTYFGLAYTFRAGSHIRVDLLIRHLGGAPRRAVEIWCCGIATMILTYFSYHTAMMVRNSYVFGDLSSGLIATPMWIPQLCMAIGSIVLTVAVAEQLVRVVRGYAPSYERSHEEVAAPSEKD
jgi:TRAP-type C4-dicarboxylate transport system permease small subunit